MAKRDELSANQKRAIVAMLSHPTLEAAAASIGLTVRTLQNYLSDATFKVELRERQDEMLASVASALVGLSGEAVATLRRVMTDPAATHASQVRAAQVWLAQMRQGVELSSLADRLAEIEKRLNGMEVRRDGKK